MGLTDVSKGRGMLDLQGWNGAVFRVRAGSGSDFTDVITEIQNLLKSHTHASATQGGQLDWDNIFSDAAHSHESAAEGATLAAAALKTGSKKKYTGRYLGSISASGDRFLMQAPCAGTVNLVRLCVDTSIATDAANYWDILVTNLTQSSDLSTSTDSGTAGAIRLAANASFKITPDVNATLNTDDVIELQLTKNASAPDLSNLDVQIEFTPTY